MQQLNKTDFRVLNELSDGRNISADLDIDRGYLNTRMRVLDDYDLVKRIGPSERSGIYEITPKGQFAGEDEEKFHDPDVDFPSYIEQQFKDN